jgi:hypothetical protein
MSVGVMKDYKLKLRNLSDSHTLCYGLLFIVYYESIKWEVKIKPIYECRCDGRLQTKRFTRLSYTGLVVELEHLKIKMFMGWSWNWNT